MEYIVKTISRIAAIFSTKDDYRLANIGDVNKIVNAFNNVFPYRMYDIQVSQSGETIPTFSKLASGAAECTSNCSSDCALCDCSKPCGNEKSGNFTVSASYIAKGTYDIRITVDPVIYPRIIKNVGFFFGGLPNGETHIGVTKLSSNVYRLTTSDRSYALQNGLLTETVLAMKVYF